MTSVPQTFPKPREASIPLCPLCRVEATSRTVRRRACSANVRNVVLGSQSQALCHRHPCHTLRAQRSHVDKSVFHGGNTFLRYKRAASPICAPAKGAKASFHALFKCLNDCCGSFSRPVDCLDQCFFRPLNSQLNARFPVFMFHLGPRAIASACWDAQPC